MTTDQLNLLITEMQHLQLIEGVGLIAANIFLMVIAWKE